DPITSADQTDAVNDGLPETLEQVMTSYHHLYWKLKVSGNVSDDVARLCRIAGVLDRLHGYHATLDGNEQYEEASGVLELWRAMEAEPGLTRLRASILFIEQPVKRSHALQESMAHLAAARPVIIDESDGTLDAFLTAKSLGYTGVSSKVCKGIWRSLINLARCRQWGQGYFMSAEDLTTLAGLCVQQDLALVSALGLAHVERNGHHFIDGFAGRPAAEARAYQAAHPDLYEDTPQGPRLRIREGLLEIGSLATPGMGSAVWPDVAAMQPMEKAAWPK
ncbi:MAG: mandelate racemase, partial [Alphaproteobacteria bacterium]